MFRRGLLIFLIIVACALGYYGFQRFTVLGQFQSTPKTIAAPAQNHLSLIAVGDAGLGGPEQFKVAQAMEQLCQEQGLDGVLYLGDNFYFDGVSSVDDPQWQSKFEQPYGTPCLKKVPFYAVLGNHDYRGSPSAQIAYSQTSEHFQMPHRFYAVSFGQLLKVIALDSNFPDFCFFPKRCMLDFFRSEVTPPEHRFTIAIAHHPLMSANTKGYSYSGQTPFGWLMRRLACHSVDAWIAGHSHHLEHDSWADCRAEHFISGGGGAAIESQLAPQGQKFTAQTYGFLHLTVTADRMKTSFYDSENRELYSSSVNHGNLR